ncbi:hypothetical protein O979_14080 [Mycobacterium avium subsp. paratuberculosis 10-4404]|nr:hypothetical protein O979_14080 [Mycobacterium avium subsp. paratuberculosis 10-4404]ETB03593.1 hypothetical protein O978_12765 [Mycobacterium avium subsp. paratuberculosis 10-5864]
MTRAASSPTTTPTAAATAPRATGWFAPAAGAAVPRTIAPSSKPKTSVAGTSAGSGQRPAAASPASSQASAEPSSTTAPATACADRSWRSPGRRLPRRPAR